MPRVAAVDGQCSVSTSAIRSSSSRPAAVQPARSMSAAGTAGSKTTTLHLNARSRLATSRPMRPKPTTPMVNVFKACMAASGTGNDHFPARICDTGCDDLPGQRQDQGQRVIGDLVDAVIGDVADRDAAVAGRLQVHVVHADAVADDDAGLAHGGDHRGVDRRNCVRTASASAVSSISSSGVLQRRPTTVQPSGRQHGRFRVERVKRVIGDGDLHDGVSAGKKRPRHWVYADSADGQAPPGGVGRGERVDYSRNTLAE